MQSTRHASHSGTSSAGLFTTWPELRSSASHRALASTTRLMHTRVSARQAAAPGWGSATYAARR